VQSVTGAARGVGHVQASPRQLRTTWGMCYSSTTNAQEGNSRKPHQPQLQLTIFIPVSQRQTGHTASPVTRRCATLHRYAGMHQEYRQYNSMGIRCHESRQTASNDQRKDQSAGSIVLPTRHATRKMYARIHHHRCRSFMVLSDVRAGEMWIYSTH
jgi:hypothetical protein